MWPVASEGELNVKSFTNKLSDSIKWEADDPLWWQPVKREQGEEFKLMDIYVKELLFTFFF